MYLDFHKPPQVPHVKVGVGHICATSADAARLPFFRAIDHRLATREEIIRGWSALKYQKMDGMVRMHCWLSLVMHPDDIEALLDEDLKMAEITLRNSIPLWEQYPVSAQVALLDMSVDMRSFVNRPKFVGAVMDGDWQTAAAESIRLDVSADRNEETKHLFLSAADSQE